MNSNYEASDSSIVNIWKIFAFLISISILAEQQSSIQILFKLLCALKNIANVLHGLKRRFGCKRTEVTCGLRKLHNILYFSHVIIRTRKSKGD